MKSLRVPPIRSSGSSARKPHRGALVAIAIAFALVCLASDASNAKSAPSPPPAQRIAARDAACRTSAHASISALDLIELQISYTTLVARYYQPVDSGAVVRGAHAAIVRRLASCGIVDRRAVVVRKGQDATERVATDVVTALVRYGNRITTQAIVRAAIAGELAAERDPYTLLFEPAEFKRFNTFLGGERFGGVGVVLDTSGTDGLARIATVLPQSPAAAAGLQEGDAIAKIDDRDATGLGIDALRTSLRGRVGTAVRLGIVRDGVPLPQPIAIVRAVVRDPQLLTRLIAPHVGYLQLMRFGDDAGGEVARGVVDLTRRGATAFVLDLRGNGGGYGEAARDVASVFIGSGTIYATRERGGAPHAELARGHAVTPAPLAVLVDRDTASASEIVAGALQDDARATIVGTRTFGKGVVQSVFPLPDGAAIKMTTARYVTPKGRDIETIGITPDVVVEQPPGARLGIPSRDAQLARALSLVDPDAASSPSPAPPSPPNTPQSTPATP